MNTILDTAYVDGIHNNQPETTKDISPEVVILIINLKPQNISKPVILFYPKLTDFEHRRPSLATDVLVTLTLLKKQKF